MSEEEIQRLVDRTEAKIARGVTKEEAIRSFQEIGLLDENGEMTPHGENVIGALRKYPNRYS
ncbi:hypothetical protein SAMN05518672_102404 [Chitinophaga sp. CF118]|uniref:hypothetical protein n=1 Tax=Chitinophaga sp. CF118 TaxID=1884367 RepID=UPI0008EED7C4|nr:hypothetical protein [Chitinophaga sp. CF118]SFD55459.1 hypothetical protein SAMN05518672_102404 [Chitinophaga sp. CF118]